jgi:hypothetical protein
MLYCLALLNGQILPGHALSDYFIFLADGDAELQVLPSCQDWEIYSIKEG